MKTAVERLHKEKFSLWGLELNKTNLSVVNLSGAVLISTNLSEANLIGANLSKANLIGANLSKANLSGANFSEAEFSRAILSESDLGQANLFNAKFNNAQIKLACNWKEATYVKSIYVEEIIEEDDGMTTFYPKWISADKQANQKRIKEIEQDRDSNPKNSPDCSQWK